MAGFQSKVTSQYRFPIPKEARKQLDVEIGSIIEITPINRKQFKVKIIQ